MYLYSLQIKGDSKKKLPTNRTLYNLEVLITHSRIISRLQKYSFSTDWNMPVCNYVWLNIATELGWNGCIIQIRMKFKINFFILIYIYFVGVCFIFFITQFLIIVAKNPWALTTSIDVIYVAGHERPISFLFRSAVSMLFWCVLLYGALSR
jgi:hypothetical protein